eukprot:6131792-Lingulodinium_polyedra.AAC.1
MEGSSAREASGAIGASPVAVSSRTVARRRVGVVEKQGVWQESAGTRISQTSGTACVGPSTQWRVA